MSPEDEAAGPAQGRPATTKISTTAKRPDRRQGSPTSSRPRPELPAQRVVDDDAAIRRVLGMTNDQLSKLLEADDEVRAVLHDRPGDPLAESMRTLLAAGRVEQRRRTSAAALASIRRTSSGSPRGSAA